MTPVGAPWMYGPGAQHRHLVCHCLLLELDDRLVLVDTGFGLADVADPRNRLGSTFMRMVRPRLDPEATAAARIEALGFAIEDVRDVVATHMDLDHIGGISDFPHARVHVTQLELDRALARPSFHDRMRYRPIQWSHGPNFRTYGAQGESWFGFGAVRGLDTLPPELLLIPLPGHTRGHVGVAVDAGTRWQLHCGDAYFFHGEVDRPEPRCPPGLRLFQRYVAVDNAVRLENQARLRTLVAEARDSVEVFCAHDSDELERLT